MPLLAGQVDDLEDETSEMSGDIMELQDDVTSLDERVGELEAGSGHDNKTSIDLCLNLTYNEVYIKVLNDCLISLF